MSEPGPLVTRASQTKIVATIGPASESDERLGQLIAAGVDVFRLNSAHGTIEQHQRRLEAIRRASREAGRLVGVLLDLAGPKMRLGELPGGQLTCNRGDRLRIVRGQPQSASELSTTYEPLVDELEPGNRVMLADGTVGLVVRSKAADYADCEVFQPGLIRSRQGLNLPGAKLSAPALSEVDLEFARWAARHEIDFLGLSFVRSPDEVLRLKKLLRDEGSAAQVIAKIEKPEALQRLEEIVAAADGVMVARGDLGVEIDIAEIAVVQKRIVEVCGRMHRPVIIATQMLDSMQHETLPTRAEATDVANAILDGADACMLSGETAIGDYPVESVQMMHRIALATEDEYRCRPRHTPPDAAAAGVNAITEASVHAASRLAVEVEAKLIVVVSASGATALSLSKNRNCAAIVGVSGSEATLRRMCLYWGVVPLAGAPTEGPRELLQHVVEWGKSSGQLSAGDRLVLIAGTGLAHTAHNMIVVHQVE
jgi:pyruvate kinase